MKILKYYTCSRVNYGTEENPKWEDILTAVEMGWNEKNEEAAKRVAYKGEYTIEDDGRPEPDMSTTADVLNALLGVM